MSESIPEAFLLVTLGNATITTSSFNQTGVLGLGYISVQMPDAPLTCADRDVYLFLRLGSVEAPIDPNTVIQRIDGEGWRSYAFHSTDVDLTEINVTFSLPADPKSSTVFMEDLEMFESILAQYVDLRRPSDLAGQTSSPVGDIDVIGRGSPDFPSQEDLRGHLVAIDQDTGKIVGQFDDRQFRIKEDPELQQSGGGDVVIIEIPDTVPSQEETPMEMFVQTVPADHQDRITKSATLFSHAISQTTNLILTTITAASNYYVSHSEPSQNYYLRPTPNARFAVTPPLPPRAFDFLTSERTRKGLAGVHAVSGQAAQVSSTTVSIIDNMIRRAMGAKAKRPRAFLPSASRSPPPRMLSPGGLPGTQPHSPSRTPSDSSESPSPSKSYVVSSFSLPFSNEKSPPPLPPRRSRSPNPSGIKNDAPLPSYSNSTPDPLFLNGRPPLPPRSSPSPAFAPVISHAGSGVPPDITPLLNHQRTTKNSLLSIDLILSTLDYSARQLLNGGAESVGTIVEHKYGSDARHTSMLLVGTARNIGLVYIDVAGIGRRALLKRAGVHFAKGRLSSD